MSGGFGVLRKTPQLGSFTRTTRFSLPKQPQETLRAKPGVPRLVTRVLLREIQHVGTRLPDRASAMLRSNGSIVRVQVGAQRNQTRTHVQHHAQPRGDGFCDRGPADPLLNTSGSPLRSPQTSSIYVVEHTSKSSENVLQKISTTCLEPKWPWKTLHGAHMTAWRIYIRRFRQ